ncbi:MAG: oligosaccharide flippase family protein [Cyclobacteriaceae bacterium]
MAGAARQSIITTIFSYTGVVVGYVNLLWLFPLILEAEQIGLFKTIQDMGLLLVPFAQLGLGHGITRYFPKIPKHQHAFFTLSLFLAIIGFLLVMVLFLVFKENIIKAYAENAPELIDFLAVVLFITFFAMLFSILESFSRSYVKVAFPTFLKEVFQRIGILISVLANYMDWISFEGMLWSLAGIYLVSVLLMGGYIGRLKIFKFDFHWFRFPENFKKDFLQYSLITLLGTAGAMLIMKIDSLMVSSMIGLNANAVYSIGFAIAVVIEMPRRAISQVAMPIISEKFAANLLSDIDEIYKKIAIHQLLICLLIFILIWVNIDNLYYFVPNREIYQAGKWVVLLIGLGKLSDVIFSVNGEIIVFSRFYLFNITATVLMCLAVILLNLLFIPIYGIEGAAFASLIAMFFYNLLKFFYIKFRLGFNPFTFNIGRILVLGLVSWSVSQFLIPKMEMVILDILLRSSLVTGVYLILAYFWKISPEAVALIESKIKNIYPK